VQPFSQSDPLGHSLGNTVPPTQDMLEDDTLVFSSLGGNAISISDSGVTSSPLEVTISVTTGKLTLGGTTNLTFIAGDCTDDATMTFQGTVADINAALDGLTFAPNADYNGPATLTIRTTDATLVALNIDPSIASHYTFDDSNDLGNDASANGNDADV